MLIPYQAKVYSHDLTAKKTGFEKMRGLGAQEKAVVFTESVRTQTYLKQYLEQQGYKGRLALYNGQSKDRQGVIEQFQKKAQVLIATEAAAEGLNLQFCSLVINYDLPWNPQRIEQRIGRCHRYGQKYDVVVINFLNEKNAADGRIYELLCHKFKLFDGVFGASDEILGRLEEGIDFERRINEIFESCRTKEEIEAAFSALQQELSEPIGEKMAKARKILLEEFGGEVAQHFGLEDIQARTETLQQQFWEVTKHILKGEFTFNDNRRVFGVFKQEVYEYEPPEYTLGRSFAYRLEAFDTPEKPKHWNFMTPREKRQWRLRPSVYTPSSKLGQQVLKDAKALPTPPAHLVFDASVFESFGGDLHGTKGWLRVEEVCVKGKETIAYLKNKGVQ